MQEKTMHLFVAIVCFFECFSIVFTKTEAKIHVSDEINLRNMVFELKSLLLDQNERIMALERHNDMQSEEIAELRTMIQTQDEKILHLQRQRACKTKIENSSILIEPTSMNVQSKKASTFKRAGISEKVIRTPAQKRIARAADTPIAFYAYSSHTFPRPSDNFILTFDTIITNLGNGYHPHSGTFIATRSGYYVFTWSFRIQHDAHISTELVVNGTPQGSVYYDATEKVGGNTGGTVVVHGDEVFIRTTNDNYNLGDILSDNAGRTYFGGWLLA